MSIGGPVVHWWTSSGKPCKRQHHPLLANPLEVLKYIHSDLSPRAILGIVLPIKKPKTQSSSKKRWRTRVPVQAPTGCRGVCRFDLNGSWGPLYRLLLDATLNYLKLSKQDSNLMLHPADAYLRFAPVLDWRIEHSRHRDDHGRFGQPIHRVGIRLSRHCSKKTLFRAAWKVVAGAAHGYPRARRWLSGVQTSPITEVRLSGCWISLKVNLGHSQNSFRRAFDQAIFELGPNAIEMPRRHLVETHLLLGLWTFYRRLIEPSARSKELIQDLHTRLGLRNVADSILNTDLFRFRRAFLSTLAPACETLRNSHVDFYLDPSSHKIVRMARQTSV